jgi:short-subunit dehydrogenase
MSSRVCLITGVSSGLGSELAALLSSDRVIVGVSRHRPLDPRWISCVAHGTARHVLGDVSEAATLAAAIESCQTMGTVDLLINCAGSGVFGPAGSYSAGDIAEAMKGNLVGTILFSDAAFRLMRDTGGTIVNVMSTAAHVGRANESVYCATKWGARGYTESLRLEAKGTKVKIVAVYPGGMNTPFWTNARNAPVDSTRFMSPAEVASIVCKALQAGATSSVTDLVINRL